MPHFCGNALMTENAQSAFQALIERKAQRAQSSFRRLMTDALNNQALTQTQLATYTGQSLAYIQAQFAGRRPATESLIASTIKHCGLTPAETIALIEAAMELAEEAGLRVGKGVIEIYHAARLALPNE